MLPALLLFLFPGYSGYLSSSAPIAKRHVFTTELPFSAVHTVEELTASITAASSSAPAWLFLPPGAHFYLTEPLAIPNGANVTLMSTDRGATIDGGGQTGLFTMDGASTRLVIESLNLTNGHATVRVRGVTKP